MNRTERGRTDDWHNDLSITIRMLEIKYDCAPSPEQRERIQSLAQNAAPLQD